MVGTIYLFSFAGVRGGLLPPKKQKLTPQNQNTNAAIILIWVVGIDVYYERCLGTQVHMCPTSSACSQKLI